MEPSPQTVGILRTFQSPVAVPPGWGTALARGTSSESQEDNGDYSGSKWQ